MAGLDARNLRKALSHQRSEVTEHAIYRRLARRTSGPNRTVLEAIAADELRHARQWQDLTGRSARPRTLQVWLFVLLSRALGLSFALKLMERAEGVAQREYGQLSSMLRPARELAEEEREHEAALLGLLQEEHLRYVGAIVLGLNDALVELTGGLAGLTLALQRTRLIALSAIVVGLAAAMSMAASTYLSTKAEKSDKAPLRSAAYTGAAYLLTVVLLVAPFLAIAQPFVALGCALLASILIIASFNFYTAVAMDRPFGRQFMEMAAISLGVAAASFGLASVARMLLGVDV